MRVRQLIRPDIMVSAIAHLSVLALIVVFAEVRRFNEVTTAPIAVDLVTPEEVKNQPQADPTPTPQLPSEAVQPPESTAPPPPPETPQAASTPAAAAPPTQAPLPDRRAAAAERKLEPQAPPSPPPPPPPPPTPSANFTPPEPDLTVKYHVMLGLPNDIPSQSGEAASSRDVPGDGIDATASSEADLSSSIVAQFRRHLKSCSRLPAQLAPSDKVMIKLRVAMTPQGRLAHDPVLIEGPPSIKGPLLAQGAIAAIKACQPYDMLPVDRYGEWKVIDLSFTPGDFAS